MSRDWENENGIAMMTRMKINQKILFKTNPTEIARCTMKKDSENRKISTAATRPHYMYTYTKHQYI